MFGQVFRYREYFLAVFIAIHFSDDSTKSKTGQAIMAFTSFASYPQMFVAELKILHMQQLLSWSGFPRISLLELALNLGNITLGGKKEIVNIYLITFASTNINSR